MFQISKYLCISTILIQGFNWSFGNFNRLELEGNILNLKTNLSVFIKNSSGILFYAIDSDYKFLIETLADKGWQQISVIYQNLNWNYKMELTYSCERTIYGDVYVTFYIHLQQSEVIIECNKKALTLEFERRENLDPLTHYPSLNEKHITILIWIGNIGPYTDKGKRKYNSSSTQLLGCVDKINFNQRRVSITSRGILFPLNCNVKYIENIWEVNYSNSHKGTLYKMYDCQITSLNGKHCINNIDYQNYSFENNSYIRTKSIQTNLILRLDWKGFQSNIGYCLMEIVFKDNSLIWFFVNKNNVLIKRNSVINTSTYTDDFSPKISSNTNNILLIESDKSMLTIKIYDGEIIQSYSHSISSEIILVNIGHFKHTNSTPLFVGNIRFQYNKTIWTNSLDYSEISTTSNPNLNKRKSVLLMSSIISVVFLILVLVSTIIFVLLHLKKGKKCNTDKNITRSKTPTPNHYEYDVIETNVDRNINVNEQMQEDNNSIEVYEKIE